MKSLSFSTLPFAKSFDARGKKNLFPEKKILSLCRKDLMSLLDLPKEMI